MVFLFLNIIRMVVITVEAYKNAKVNTITVKNKELFWVKMIDVKNGLKLKNIPDLLRKEMCGMFETSDVTGEQKKKCIRTAKEISNELKNDCQNCKYARSDIIEKIIKNCRGVKKCNDDINRTEKKNQRENFRALLGFTENDIYESKEYSITKKIKKTFKNKIINEQYRVKKYFNDLVFSVHKLGIEIDENGHIDRSEIKEQKIIKIIKEETGFEIIRIHSDRESFDIFDFLQTFIYDSGRKLAEKSTKNKMIEDTEKLNKMIKQLCV